MEIKITTNQILKVLQILSWIIFIGLCIEAGSISVNTVISLFINPHGVNNFWEGKTYLSTLFSFDRGYFFVVTLTMIIASVLKAIMFYLIVKLFTEKKIKMSQPFNTELKQFIITQSYLALGIGVFSQMGIKYTMWLSQQGLNLPDVQALHIAGADVWIFMAIILFIIAQVVKKGVEMQNENDLTI